MKIQFGNHTTWRTFYSEYGLEISEEPNESGWIECNCPIHPHNDKKKKYAAINVYSGNFKCWGADCQSNYREKLGYNLESQVLTPREFLIVVHDVDKDEAHRRVQEFIENIDPTILDVCTWDKVYRPNKEWQEEALLAASKLDESLDIVQEYIKSRGLRFETLQQFKIGYVEDAEEFLTLPYFYNGAVVGFKCRTIDGRKTNPKGSYSCLYNMDNAINSASKIVIVVEGETDCLYLTQTLQDNNLSIPVIATPGALFKKEWERDLRQFKKIICIPQADDAAEGLVKGLKKALPKKLEILSLPWKPLTWGKDVCDFCRQHDVQILLDLIGNETIKEEKRVYTGDEFILLSDIDVPYLVPHLIERNTKVFIVGEPKTYKTWIALQLMDSLVNKTPFLGIDQWTPILDNLRVMLIEEEGARHRMGARLKKVTNGNGVDRIRVIHRQSVLVDEANQFLKLVEDIREFMPDLLIFDPFVMLHTQDENSASGTNIVMTAFNKLLTIFPQMAIVVIHHAPKANTRGIRGSSNIFGSIDELISVTRNSTGLIELELRGRDLVDGDYDSVMLRFNTEIGKHEPLNIDVITTQAEEDSMGRPLSHRNRLIKAIVDRIKKKPDIELHHSKLVASLSGIASGPTVTSAIQYLLDKEILIQNAGSGGKGRPKIYHVNLDLLQNWDEVLDE